MILEVKGGKTGVLTEAGKPTLKQDQELGLVGQGERWTPQMTLALVADYISLKNVFLVNYALKIKYLGRRLFSPHLPLDVIEDVTPWTSYVGEYFIS